MTEPTPDSPPASVTESVGSAPQPAEPATPPPPNPSLTPEEQMAAFENDLKENDWGHQPC